MVNRSFIQAFIVAKTNNFYLLNYDHTEMGYEMNGLLNMLILKRYKSHNINNGK